MEMSLRVQPHLQIHTFFPFHCTGGGDGGDPEYGIQQLKYQAFLIQNSIEWIAVMPTM